MLAFLGVLSAELSVLGGYKLLIYRAERLPYPGEIMELLLNCHRNSGM